jgi:hypothetical protein
MPAKSIDVNASGKTGLLRKGEATTRSVIEKQRDAATLARLKTTQTLVRVYQTTSHR